MPGNHNLVQSKCFTKHNQKFIGVTSFNFIDSAIRSRRQKHVNISDDFAEDIQLVFDIYFEGITQNDTA